MSDNPARATPARVSPAVQRRLRQLIDEAEVVRGQERPWPEVDEALVAHLEWLYPPRCLGLDETVEDHLRYAGKADLVQHLRYMLDQSGLPPEGRGGVEQ